MRPFFFLSLSNETCCSLYIQQPLGITKVKNNLPPNQNSLWWSFLEFLESKTLKFFQLINRISIFESLFCFLGHCILYQNNWKVWVIATKQNRFDHVRHYHRHSSAFFAFNSLENHYFLYLVLFMATKLLNILKGILVN